MRIALLFNKDRDDTTGCYFERVLKKSNLEFKHFPVEGFKKVRERFDLYLRIDHGDYKFDISKRLHPAVFLAIDTHLKKPYKKILHQAKHYDFVFASQKEGAEKLSQDLKRKVFWLPLACEPEIHKRENIEKRYDVGFVGSFGGKGSLREDILLTVKREFPNSFIGKAHYTEMSKIYSSSKIGLNCSLNNDINMRMFEILSCGTMLLTNRIKDNGFGELFVENRHLIVYNSKEELIGLIRYYLENDRERETIARSGYDLAINYHTYKDRLSKMFAIIRQWDEDRFRDLKL